MKKLTWKVCFSISSASFMVACDSYKEPKTLEEWKAFCEAPDSFEKIKAITDEKKQQKAGSTCFRAPWIQYAPSPPKAW